MGSRRDRQQKVWRFQPSPSLGAIVRLFQDLSCLLDLLVPNPLWILRFVCLMHPRQHRPCQTHSLPDTLLLAAVRSSRVFASLRTTWSVNTARKKSVPLVGLRDFHPRVTEMTVSLEVRCKLGTPFSPDEVPTTDKGKTRPFFADELVNEGIGTCSKRRTSTDRTRAFSKSKRSQPAPKKSTMPQSGASPSRSDTIRLHERHELQGHQTHAGEVLLATLLHPFRSLREYLLKAWTLTPSRSKRSLPLCVGRDQCYPLRSMEHGE